eukprot:tig00001066_g6755.t1
MITNFATARKIYDELSQKIADARSRDLCVVRAAPAASGALLGAPLAHTGDEATLEDTLRVFIAAAVANAAALKNPQEGPALDTVAAAATAFTVAVAQLTAENRPDCPPGPSSRAAPRAAQDLLPTAESGLDEGEKKVAFDAVDAALEEIALSWRPPGPNGGRGR